VVAGQNQTRAGDHKLGIVTFGNDATLVGSLTSQTDVLENAIDKLATEASTNMAAGLQLAVDQLKHVGGGARRVVILLSDGVPTAGLGRSPDLKQEIRDFVLPALRSNADCVYVVGLGDTEDSGVTSLFSIGFGPDLDEAFLKEIAATTSC